MYDCLHLHIECLNDDPWPSFVNRLKTSATARDAAYLCFARDAQGREGLSIDFEAMIALYFWDTDFLLEPSTFYQLDTPSRQQLGYRADLFGVLSGLLPHPTELVLESVDEVEAMEVESEEANGDR